ncbi:type I secretion system permease/ATPase [Rhodoblastus sphagnicola]|uniref:Type I secretion system permease/ATPase n=1 Tax=Rhodoblastus sphagnicola TaxID=333368 RepID=A0A2S6NB89_9HYPH|nr:type I secretion system permease/ATPase [Rhodoblastus sphagnicola]MBB4197748.1 subfamily B ATP-binding cassette protein HlyB/CyaB [Rhodoblastus sphagnicola]PPQ31892.1 type I secretion system permease/ATPase [Rhodoblastus sphagnicola]
MNQRVSLDARPEPLHASGLAALCGIAAYYRIAADPAHLAKELALGQSEAAAGDLVRAARLIGLKARIVEAPSSTRLASAPVPALLRLKTGVWCVFGGKSPAGLWRIVDPVTRIARELAFDDLIAEIDPLLILVARKFQGAGIDPKNFGFMWFAPSLWRYRKPLIHVLVASLFVQLFALVSPLFFQVVIDKVLTHRGYSTLFVLVGGLALIGLFDIALQYLRTYALSHTTNRIDVELGQRLFRHLAQLPVSYFETRPTGQTVARLRELETIRAFLTGQGLFSALDLVFTFIFIAVLFAYSWKLTMVVLATIPLYLVIAAIARPLLREKLNEKFNRGAESQQFLVESIVGMQTIKAAAVEPVVAKQWEERLAAYVRSAFDTTMLGAKGQNAIQYVNKLSTAALLLFGAKAVIDGDLSVGELVAFNMIAGQVAQPVLRLSQLWQDFQQVQVSVERLGDILNSAPEPTPAVRVHLPPPRGKIEFRNVSFRYRTDSQQVLKQISLRVNPGKVIGIVGPSGSGKSTLTKLIQRFYIPEEGQVLLDDMDLAQVDPAWLRTHIGVVLQENLLFNRSIHDNIALSNPAMPRAQVMNVARLAGADEFIGKLPQGYDTMIEERGANLSGGQRQRIAIARALSTNPPILIFDEATSALDYESERIVQRNMRQIVQNRTVFIIAHRLAAVRDCDVIIGMIDGRLVEAGSHDELLKNPNGLYSRLWSMQNDRSPA